MKGFIVISAKLIGYNSILARIISKNSKKIRMQNLRKNTLQQFLMFKWSVKPQKNIKYESPSNEELYSDQCEANRLQQRSRLNYIFSLAKENARTLFTAISQKPCPPQTHRQVAKPAIFNHLCTALINDIGFR